MGEGLTDWLTKWGKDWLTDWLTGWLADWLSGQERKLVPLQMKSSREKEIWISDKISMIFFLLLWINWIWWEFPPLYSLGYFQKYFLKLSLSFPCDETLPPVLNGSSYFRITSLPCCIPSSIQFRYSSNTYDRYCIVFMLLKMLWSYKFGKEIDEISVMIFALHFRWIRNNM